MFVRASLATFAHKSFRAIWLAALFSNLGSWIEDVGEAWLMVGLGGSPLMVSLVTVTGVLPVVLLSFPAGALADQVDRRRFLLVTQGWMAAVALGLAIETHRHHVGPVSLLLFTTALGIGLAVNGPAFQSLVPDLVPREDLPQAVALNSLNFNLGRALGPAIGGLLVSTWGPAVTFYLNAISFFAVIGVVAKIKVPSRTPRKESILRSMADGMSLARRSVELRTTFLGIALFSLPAASTTALLPIFTAATLHGGGAGFGLLLAVIGVGATLGAVMLPLVRSRFRPKQYLPGMMAIYAICVMCLSFTERMGSAMLVLLPMGAAQLVTVSTYNALTQMHAPDRARGRLMALYTVSFLGSLSIGGTVGGAIANHVGVVATYRVMALVVAAAGVVVAMLPIPIMERAAFSDHPAPSNG